MGILLWYYYGIMGILLWYYYDIIMVLNPISESQGIFIMVLWEYGDKSNLTPLESVQRDEHVTPGCGSVIMGSMIFQRYHISLYIVLPTCSNTPISNHPYQLKEKLGLVHSCQE